MGQTTAISWTQRTWNPWQGCHKVARECEHCYMYAEKRRYGQVPNVVKRSAPATFNAPLSKKWAEPGLVFACSWSDFFHADADEWRREAWDIIRQTPHLTYQIPTKRPERVRGCLPHDWGDGWSNVWLGVSAGTQERLAESCRAMYGVPAAVWFVSAEPLLEPLDFRIAFPEFSWVIVGGESGPGARPCNVSWVRSVRSQCAAAGVPCFVKQLGANPVVANDAEHCEAWPGNWVPFAPSYDPGYQGEIAPLKLRHAKGGDMAEWPIGLRVQQYPEAAHG